MGWREVRRHVLADASVGDECQRVGVNGFADVAEAVHTCCSHLLFTPAVHTFADMNAKEERSVAVRTSASVTSSSMKAPTRRTFWREIQKGGRFEWEPAAARGGERRAASLPTRAGRVGWERVSSALAGRTSRSRSASRSS